VKVSKRTLEALKILNDHPYGISGKYFGKEFWPGGDMHSRVVNTGHGATVGQAGWLCAGSYLAKLRHAGLAKEMLCIYSPRLTTISKEGKAILERGGE
jgi:hypothetical protein